MDYQELSDLIVRLRDLVEEANPEKGYWKEIWSLARAISEGFHSARFPTRADKDEAWTEFQRLRGEANQRSAADRARIEEQKKQWETRQQHSSAIRSRLIVKTAHTRPPDSPGPAATTLYDVFLRLRDFNEILQRAKLADKLWAFRFGRPFRAGIDQQVFEATVQFVLDHPETDLFFVYREPDLDDPEAAIYEAKKSFAAIQFKIDAHPKPSEQKALRERIHGIPVRGAEADKLGLVDPWVVYAAAEYSDRGYAEHKRAIDVWVETLFEDVEEKRLAWLELPPAEALKWMQRRAKILAEALKRAADRGDGTPQPKSRTAH